MFTSLTQLRRNPKLNFIDKETAASLAVEKSPLPVLDCVSRADGLFPHTHYFLMLTENYNVTKDQYVQVTPAQKALLQLLDHNNAGDYSSFLKSIHELGTYFCAEKDLIDLEASYHVSVLQEAIASISNESQLLKSA